MRTIYPLFSFAFLLWLLAGCSTRQLPPLAERFRTADSQVDLSALERTAEDLDGSPRDIPRLQLVEGQNGEIYALDNGWLCRITREGETWQVWLAPGGLAELLARGHNVRLLDRQQDRVLLFERWQGEQARLFAIRPGGKATELASGQSAALRVGAAGRLLFLSEELQDDIFFYSEQSWRLEQQQEILRHGSGWSLAKPVDSESPFRVLHRFLQAARQGKWSRARQEVLLERLLALPDGSHSRKLAASLKLSVPHLLDKQTRLLAPLRGEIRRLQEYGATAAWRVKLDPQSTGSWKLSRLERVMP